MPADRLIFVSKEPDEVLDYQIDTSAKITGTAGTINAVSVTVAPAGSGEMVASQIVVSGSLITICLSGGYPARVYQVNVLVSTSGNRTYEWPAVLMIANDLAGYPITPPAITGFGAPATWTA